MDYNERLSVELSNYNQALEQGGLANSIPEIFSYWAGRYLAPRVRNVFGHADINRVFASELLSGHPRRNGTFRVLSLGSGDCRTEIAIAKIILEQSPSVTFICLDVNEAVVSKAKQLCRESGLDGMFEFQICDLNLNFPKIEFDGVMANHSLHHFLGLETIFDSILKGLNGGATFVINDMIGRNGHMRWPEALPFVEQIWRLLPDDRRFNNHAQCHEGADFVNYDCTVNGDFEGVRSQDILPLLLERFAFRKFVSFGNVIDIFLDRTYGPNFSVDRQDDLKMIDYIEELNSHLIDTGIIKPTMMISSLRLKGELCSFDRWSPEFSVRRPGNVGSHGLASREEDRSSQSRKVGTDIAVS